MKYREKLGYIALGGFLMLIGVLAAGLFSPLEAAEQPDVNFRKITCTELNVVRRDGTVSAEMGSLDSGVGFVGVYADDRDTPGVFMFATKEGGQIDVYGAQAYKMGDYPSRVRMGVEGHGGYVGGDG